MSSLPILLIEILLTGCLAFGFLAVIIEKLAIPVLPLVIGLILAPLMEDALRQTISMGGGSLAILRIF